MKAFHDDPCGGHFVDKKIVNRVLRQEYYFPTIFKDTKKYVRSYEKCQRMGKSEKTDEIQLQPQIILEPIEKWVLEFLGPINPPLK